MSTLSEKIARESTALAATHEQNAEFARRNATTIDALGSTLNRISGCDPVASLTDLGVQMYSCVSDLDTFKDLRLIEAIEAIERNLGTQCHESKPADYFSTPARVFRFNATLDGLTCDVDLVAVIGSKSTSCRRVQVGVTVQEHPVFEVVCE